MNNCASRTDRALSCFKTGATGISSEIRKPRQCKRRQNPQNHNHHNQFDQGKTALLFLHFDAPKGSWYYGLNVVTTVPSAES